MFEYFILFRNNMHTCHISWLSSFPRQLERLCSTFCSLTHPCSDVARIRQQRRSMSFATRSFFLALHVQRAKLSQISPGCRGQVLASKRCQTLADFFIRTPSLLVCPFRPKSARERERERENARAFLGSGLKSSDNRKLLISQKGTNCCTSAYRAALLLIQQCARAPALALTFSQSEREREGKKL